MIKRTTIASLFLALLFVMAGCAAEKTPVISNAEGTPSLPNIAAGDTVIPVIQSSYCWERTCADYPGPIKLLKGYLPTVVAPNTSIHIAFDYKPAPNQLHASLSVDEYEDQDIPLTDGAFHAPKQPGTYYFSISANWMSDDGRTSKGHTSAAFGIEVKG
ncbi:hypothetical protein [Paenibacillus kobensis]|uniref:hypothetical protein n=1 Tax=Paenibacillus kobensis TaxID=59841 RepID=UPI000FD84AA3|nr:hypothetical protein [Paenibacillus kobensis]